MVTPAELLKMPNAQTNQEETLPLPGLAELDQSIKVPAHHQFMGTVCQSLKIPVLCSNPIFFYMGIAVIAIVGIVLARKYFK